MIGKWRTYEWLVYNYYCRVCQQNNNDWIVEYDKKIPGRSDANRQIDILIESQSQNMIKVIDCKYHKAIIDIKEVDSIIGMLEDVRANAGVIVSPIGFTPAADKRAKDYGRLELIIINLHDLFPYRFDNNIRIDRPCPSCYGKKNIFSQTINHTTVNMTGYDIVYREDKMNFSKVNVGFCHECMCQVFYCTECNAYIYISIEDIGKGIVKKCKCGVGYLFYCYVDAYGNEQITYSYFDEDGNELFSENNIYYMYNKYGITLDNY